MLVPFLDIEEHLQHGKIDALPANCILSFFLYDANQNSLKCIMKYPPNISRQLNN